MAGFAVQKLSIGIPVCLAGTMAATDADAEMAETLVARCVHLANCIAACSSCNSRPRQHGSPTGSPLCGGETPIQPAFIRLSSGLTLHVDTGFRGLR
jgi:hypothetical protein